MKKEFLNKLNTPYKSQQNELFDNRFSSEIGADIPSVAKLVNEIFSDLDKISFGISWWKSLPTQERILISDYLYQCVSSIETNLVEAKLHLLEWISAREKNNEYISKLIINEKPPKSPIEELYLKLEELHICGFFRAIGSSLDCLGATIIGVLALPLRKSKSLRRSDIKITEEALNDLTDLGTFGSKLQINFRDYYNAVKTSVGPKDWLDWTDQNRNMYVHRGRRIIQSDVTEREPHLYDSKGELIPKFKSIVHLPKYPDRSDVEALIKGIDITLTEDAEKTLSGIFKSTRDLIETLSERLIKIWHERRANPKLLDQPQNHWDSKIKSCNFNGYENHNVKQQNTGIVVNPIFGKRMMSSAMLDHQRSLWNNSNWS